MKPYTLSTCHMFCKSLKATSTLSLDHSKECHSEGCCIWCLISMPSIAFGWLHIHLGSGTLQTWCRQAPGISPSVWSRWGSSNSAGVGRQEKEAWVVSWLNTAPGLGRNSFSSWLCYRLPVTLGKSFNGQCLRLSLVRWKQRFLSAALCRLACLHCRFSAAGTVSRLLHMGAPICPPIFG